MSRRAASISQADIARAIRAARQTGADCVEVIQRNGTVLRIVLNSPSIVPSHDISIEGRQCYPDDAAEDL